MCTLPVFARFYGLDTACVCAYLPKVYAHKECPDYEDVCDIRVRILLWPRHLLYAYTSCVCEWLALAGMTVVCIDSSWHVLSLPHPSKQ